MGAIAPTKRLLAVGEPELVATYQGSLNDDPLVDSYSGVLANVSDFIGNLHTMQRYNGSSWVGPVPDVTVGTTIGFRCSARNDGTAPVYAILTIGFQDPNGQSAGTPTNRQGTLSAGAQFTHEKKITAAMQGGYTVYVSLYFSGP